MKNQYELKIGLYLRSKITIFIVLLFMGLFINGCHLPRGGQAQPIDKWEVTQYFCLGDSINVSWNLQPGFDRRNCGKRCQSPSDCLAGTLCVDSVCTNRPLPPGSAVPPEGQCAPDTELTITSSEGTDLVSHTHDSSGSRSLTPSDSITFTANGGYQQPLRFYNEENKTATLVTPDTEPVQLRFPFICPIGWRSHDIGMDGPSVSEHVTIAGIQNTSGITIDLSGPNHSGQPIRLRPGEETAAFNGKLMGIWTAEIPPVFRVGLPPARCTATEIDNPYPDLSVALRLTCTAMN